MISKPEDYNEIQFANTVDTFLSSRWDSMTNDEKDKHLAMHDSLQTLGELLRTKDTCDAVVEEAVEEVREKLYTILEIVY